MRLGILAAALAFTVSLFATGERAPLRLAQTIALPGVEGRIDHFAIDLKGERLFVCALGNNSLEVIDLHKGEPIHSISGLGNPQGAVYLPDRNRLLVSSDRNGACQVYDGKSFAPLGSVD